jgi:hypothetical protein
MAEETHFVADTVSPSRSFALGELPDDLLATILHHLSPAQISVVTSRVCRAWEIGLNRRAWLSLAQAHDIPMPRGDASAVSLRSAKNLRRAYFQSVARRAKHRQAEAEAVLIKLWGRLVSVQELWIFFPYV